MNLQQFLTLAINLNGMQNQNFQTQRQRNLAGKVRQLNQTVQLAKALISGQVQKNEKLSERIKSEEAENKNLKKSNGDFAELIIALVEEKVDEQYISNLKNNNFNEQFIQKLKKHILEVKEKENLLKCLKAVLFKQTYIDEKKYKELVSIVKKPQSKVKRVFQKVQSITNHINQLTITLSETLSQYDSSRHIPHSDDSEFVLTGVTALIQIVKQSSASKSVKEVKKNYENQQLQQYKKKCHKLQQKIITMKEQFKFQMGELKEEKEQLLKKVQKSIHSQKQLTKIKAEFLQQSQSLKKLSSSSAELQLVKPKLQKLKTEVEELQLSKHQLFILKDQFSELQTKFSQRQRVIANLKAEKEQLQTKFKTMRKGNIKIKNVSNEDKKNLNLSTSVQLLKSPELFKGFNQQEDILEEDTTKLKKQVAKLKCEQIELKDKLNNAYSHIRKINKIKQMLDEQLNNLDQIHEKQQFIQ